MQGLVRAVRAAGATQPIVAMGWKDDRLFEGAGDAALIDDPNIVYEASPRFANTRTDGQRDAHLGRSPRACPYWRTAGIWSWMMPLPAPRFPQTQPPPPRWCRATSTTLMPTRFPGRCPSSSPAN